MEIAIIISCLILSAFFSGMEIAYIASNKVYLSIEKKQNTFFSKILSRLTEKPSRFIASMLLGKSIVFSIYGYFSSALVVQLLREQGVAFTPFVMLIMQVVIATLLILLTSSFLPKVIFQIYPNTLIKVLALPAYGFYLLFSGISKIIVGIADKVIVCVFKLESDKEQLSFNKGELGTYISEQMNAAENQEEIDTEIQIFQNALEFSDLKVRDIMTPRTEISAVEIEDPVSELRELFIETGYSKIVVYNDTLDNVVGYVHSFELFKKPVDIKTVMIPIEYVPETVLIKEVLDILTKKRKSMAVVMDEYGGTSGIVTVEDIIEELFGEIEDEHDLEELIEEKRKDNSYLFSARLNVEYVNQKYSLKIPESDSYVTLGGFIVHATKEIPQEGQELNLHNFKILIREASNKKIELIEVRIRE
ncbi:MULTISPECIES: hemolysin family protein [unclassified Flavobacterium]|uniref:hemolysin family protein n=1 Tax=unclassified Flavobacterium TaxID=196869 RepID=UPI00095DEA6E|nr:MULTISPECIES: hemolysin family protein [unclassified Flavobacterium]MBN9283932.1 HlyC/CorC family transporter [Flavobacterium sp.]OJV73409.1 MAG: hemolysin [Flavobacterium sp. 40-81]